jgi:hypothetical protein
MVPTVIWTLLRIRAAGMPPESVCMERHNQTVRKMQPSRIDAIVASCGPAASRSTCSGVRSWPAFASAAAKAPSARAAQLVISTLSGTCSSSDPDQHTEASYKHPAADWNRMRMETTCTSTPHHACWDVLRGNHASVSV